MSQIISTTLTAEFKKPIKNIKRAFGGRKMKIRKQGLIALTICLSVLSVGSPAVFGGGLSLVKTGFLVVAPDRNFLGNMETRAIFDAFKKGSPTALASAGGHETVLVELKEGSLTPDKASIPNAGKVTFKVKNTGTVAHEMVILKTDLPANALIVSEGKVKEEAAGKVIGEIEEFSPNAENEITLDLAAGNYVLFCNVVENGQAKGHYQQGMRAAFTVGSVSKRKSADLLD